MANPERGEVALTVGDQTYTLVLDFEAYCVAERMMSKDEGRIVAFPEIFAGVMSGSWRHIRALLCGAFSTHQPKMTPEQIGKVIVDGGGPKAMVEKIAELRELSVPEGQRARPRKARQQKSKAGARTTSTRAASTSAQTPSGG